MNNINEKIAKAIKELDDFNKVNKYQEILDKFKEDYEEAHSLGIGTHYDIVDIDNLQELVDRATPKKPIQFADCLLRCSKCFNVINILEDYCPKCGKAIDWSDD